MLKYYILKNGSLIKNFNNLIYYKLFKYYLNVKIIHKELYKTQL